MRHHLHTDDPHARTYRTPPSLDASPSGAAADPSTSTVAAYLNTRLAEIGVSHVFAIPGDYVAEWVATLDDEDQNAGLVRVHPNNEMCATYAADGQARSAAGTVGCVAFTYGVGAINAAQAVGGALVEGVPLVVVNGSPSAAQFRSERDQGVLYHHMLDGSHSDQRIFDEVTSMTVRIDNPATAPDLIDAALVHCVTTSTPVYVELQNGVPLMACRPVPDEPLVASPVPQASASLQEATDAIMDHLRVAERVVFVAGAELARAGVGEAFAGLVAAVDAPYVTSGLGKGVLSERRTDIRFAGTYVGKSAQANVQELLEAADCVVALGVKDTDFNYLGIVTPDYVAAGATDLPGPTHVQARDGAVLVGRGLAYWGDVALGPLIDALTAAVESEPPDNAPFPGLASGTPWDLPDPDDFNADDPITWDSFKAALAGDWLAGFGEDDHPVVVADSGFSFVALTNVPVVERGYVAQFAWAAIGYGTGATPGVGLSAAAHDPPRRTVTVSGDGAFSQTVNALGTVAQLGHDAVVFVMDNRVFAVEQWLIDADAFCGDAPPPDFTPLTAVPQGAIWDYVKLAEGFGGRGYAVSTNAELRQVLAGLDDVPTNPTTGAPTFTLVAVRVPAKDQPDTTAWKSHCG